MQSAAQALREHQAPSRMTMRGRIVEENRRTGVVMQRAVEGAALPHMG